MTPQTTHFTVEQALASAGQQPLEDAIIIGTDKDTRKLVIRSSKMSRESALWLIEHARMHVLNV